MVVQLKEYTSAQAIAEALDKDLSETKSLLGEYLRRLDEIRTLAEKSKKVREVIMKLAGKKTSSTDTPGEITVGTLNIILDANAFHELTAIESVVRSHQERLVGFTESARRIKMARPTRRHRRPQVPSAGRRRHPTAHPIQNILNRQAGRSKK